MSDEISEYAQRFLAELEELRSLDVHAIMNGVFAPDGTPDELEKTRLALSELLTNGLVTIGIEQWNPRKIDHMSSVDALRFLSDFRTWCRFGPSLRGEGWFPAAGYRHDAPYPIVSLTPAGLAAARLFLGERGYRWWKRTVT